VELVTTYSSRSVQIFGLTGFATIGAGRVGVVLAQVVSIRALTHFLPAGEVGRNYILFSSTAWFALVMLSPLVTYLERCVIEWKQEGSALANLRRLAAYCFGFTALATATLTVVNETLGLGVQVGRTSLGLIVIGHLLAGTFSGAVVSLINILGARVHFVLLGNLAAWGALGLSVAFVSLLAPTAELWLAGQFVAQGAVALVGLGFLLRMLGGARAPSAAATPDIHASTLFRFGWPMAIGVGLYWMLTQGYRFVLVARVNAEFVGFFGVGFAIGGGILVAYEILFKQLYQPIFFHAISGQAREARAKAWNDYASAFLPTMLVIATFVAAASPFLVTLLASPAFREAQPVLMWAAASEALRMTSGMYYFATLAEKDMRLLMLPNFAGAVTTIGLVALLAPISPVHGTGVGLCLGNVVVLVLLMVTVGGLTPVQLPWRQVGTALVLSAPLGLLLTLGPDLGRELASSLLVLSAAGLYLLAVLGFLARNWMAEPRAPGGTGSARVPRISTNG
jgi:O-antigen/teichoic acid export membrane protein